VQEADASLVSTGVVMCLPAMSLVSRECVAAERCGGAVWLGKTHS
jgi:hypothetical protein